MRASTATRLVRDERRIERGDRARDGRGLGLLVGVRDDPHHWAVGSGRAQLGGLLAACEHVHAGGDDLRRAAVVDGQPHDLDAGEAVLDIQQQRGVAAVEAVDRLRGIADEVQVVASGAEEIEQALLERVQVLRLVDEDVTEAPALGLGVVGVALERVDR